MSLLRSTSQVMMYSLQGLYSSNILDLNVVKMMDQTE